MAHGSKLPANDGNREPPDTARAPARESALVVTRFLARMIILCAFAMLGTQGFAKTIETLLAMAALYCAIVAPIRREAPFGLVFTHFDEGAAYAVCARIAFWAS